MPATKVEVGARGFIRPSLCDLLTKLSIKKKREQGNTWES